MKAKKKRTRLWSILLVLVMVVGMLPTTALAAVEESAAFDSAPDKALNLFNAAKTGTEDSTWNSETKTLTLNGVDFRTTNDTAVYLPAGTTIVLHGENYITGGDAKESPYNVCAGIRVLGNLTISGDGSLTVTSGDSTQKSGGMSFGIFAINGNSEVNVTINGGTVVAKAGKSHNHSMGIYAGWGNNGNVTISGNAHVIAMGSESAYNDSIGIVARDGNVTISGNAQVEATGGKSKKDNSIGINAGKALTVAGSAQVKAIGSEAYGYSKGINTESTVNIKDSAQVEASGSAVGHTSAGIYGAGNVTISDTTRITATAGATGDRSYGIRSGQNVNITGGIVSATASTVTCPEGHNWTSGESGSAGIRGKNVTISGGTVIAAAGTATDSSSVVQYEYCNDILGTLTLTAEGYKNSFDANGGTGFMSFISGTSEGHDCKLPANGFTAPSGKQFKGWSVDEGAEKAAGDSITVSSGTNVKAIWEDITYTVSFDANGGSGTMADVTGVVGDYELPANSFTAPAGQKFKGWATSTNGTVISASSINVTGDTTLYAIWEPMTYAVSVTYGTANPVGAQAAGTSITITANEPAEGMQFKAWTSADDLTFTSGSEITAKATFTMPNSAVSLIATYEPIPVTEYNINVTGGTASVGGSTVSKAAAGTTVTLTANRAPSGQVFDKWEVVSGGITLADANSATTTFTMPAGDVSVKATYKSAPTTGGGGGYIPPVHKPIVKNDDNETTSADLKDTTSTSGGKTIANVDKAIGQEIVDKAVANESKEIVIDANAKNASAAAATVIAQISIPRDTLAAIAEKTEADVTVKNDVAEIKLDNSAAGAVAEQAAGDTIQVIVEKVAEKENKVEFQLKVVCSAGNVISDFQGGNVAVTVAIPKEMADKKVVCVYIDDNGKMSKVKGQKNEDGTYTFTTGHFSTYVLMPEEEADVAIAAQQKEEILAKLDSYELVARSAAGKTPGGKKAIKIRVYDKNGLSTDFFDGIEIYRSTKKNSGYGKKPVFVIKSGKSSYYNTAIKSATRYYYKVRGFVMIDGQKYYTDYSLKAIRTAK